jgi:electron transfer flavoprotein beta subunit
VNVVGEIVNVVVCFKSVYDDVAIRITPDKKLDYSAVPHVVSLYDLNALEAAVQFVEAGCGKHSLRALSVGDASIHDSTMRKNVAARGAGEVHFVMDEALQNAQTYQSAQAAAGAIKRMGNVDLIICGDGSADLYSHQMGIQLGELLGAPTINAVSGFYAKGTTLFITRELDNEIEHIEVETPAVLSVNSSIATPRVCQVKDIMTAGSKPVYEFSLADLGTEIVPAQFKILETIVPDQAPRKNKIYASTTEEIDAFVAQLHAYLISEGA